ncbi:hypothetical protein ACFOWX_07345 [Sphingorhabdus arenilitoris]|uniref:DUF11 domain-containing protein n=1 Tax=Sphingorhabdus arenilitoris TaxID=1490041 RepID=A0ABV8RFV1_9SPHN
MAAGTMLPAANNAAQAQTNASAPKIISNTALAEWDVGPNTLSRPSNTVNISVQPVVRPPATLSLFHFSNAPGATTANLGANQCIGNNGATPVTLGGAFAGTSTSPASLVPATAIRAGEPLVIQVDDAVHNADPGAIEQFEVTITTANGDRERITLIESEANSGRFRGIINTAAVPATPVQGDCTLSVRPGDELRVELDDNSTGTDIGTGEVDILVDPFGLTFDSANGVPVEGTRVTIVDANTGVPAQVFGDDGVSDFPNSVIVGSTVTDSGGNVYNFPTGFYRFPFLRRGDYRLVIVPPAPYTHPSVATPAELAALTRPDGGAFAIVDGSYGGVITLDDPAPVRIDVPLDRPGGALTISKSTSTQNAMPGDVVQYRIQVSNPDPARASAAITVTDQLPRELRLRQNSVRYQGASIIPIVAADGSNFSVTLPSLGGGQSGIISYLAEVRQDARPGNAINLASARDARGAVSDTVDAPIRIVRDGISERMTIIGRVTEGGCNLDPNNAPGIPGVRVMLEDGTYTVTDADGRYHFEGIIPGIHVVQVDPGSFPLDQEPVNCTQNTRSAGSAISRFVEGRGGSLKRADFRSRKTEARAQIAADVKPIPTAMSDQDAAGSNTDWLKDQGPGRAFLFPGTDHNPRVRAIRIVVKHAEGERVELLVNGKAVDPLNYDGQKKNSDGSIRASIWRGVNIEEGNNVLTARIVNSDKKLLETLTQNVYYAGAPIQAQFIKELSVLRADGVTRPRIAVRLTDRNGKPIQHDSVGDFSVTDPYRAAVEADAQQAAQLSGLERAAPVWRVNGDDGIAYIELESTTASGTVSIGFNFVDGKVKRQQRIETWLDPGNRPWTVVGFAAGTIGFNKLNDGLEDLADQHEDEINVDGRIALYAKGRVSGKWLLTLAYDSDKKEDETRFAGVIDPRRYYTIYADRAEQRYDAASTRRLYLKLERPQFYALFGDYATGIDEPELARYQRSYNGIKAEYRSDQLSAQIFGADTPYRYRREEIQGNGLTGPYALSSRDILANSERITLQTRDRLRSDRIVDETTLVRHIDYDIDYLAGTLIFRSPILSRDSGLNPQFIIAEYEVDGIGQRVNNAGGRVRWNSKDEKLHIGATAIHDETDSDKTNLAGIDVRYAPTTSTEIRAEFAGSDGKANSGSANGDAGRANAWLVEAEHHTGTVDILAYVREQEARFGVGQQNRSEIGTRKYGVDARLRLNDNLSIAALAYQEEYLDTDARRRAAGSELEYRKDDTTLRAGLTHANDRLDDGSVNKSTIAKLAASQKLFDNKLELGAQTEFALGGQDESIDFPARHTLSARYSVARDIQLIGSYEIAKGENIDARTARLGFDLAPWAGGRILASANQQDIGEYGPRTFAAYGLAQSFKINDKWSVDLSVDGNKTLSGIDRGDVLNPLQPVASGGFLGSDSSLTEDFTALTAGATYRDEKWSWTGRAEYRDGETVNRYGFTSAILRRIGEGQAVAGAFSWLKAEQSVGASTESAAAEISWAHRPSSSDWAFLNKLELRHDAVRGAISGLPGPIGGVGLTIDGDATSRRIINSLSVNYTPKGRDDDILGSEDGNYFERGEYSLFWGTRYASEKIGADDVEGWSNVIGADFRFDLSKVADIGGQATVRIGSNGSNIAYSGGPAITVAPFENANISLGYNIVGFADRDFEESRYTRSGPFVTLKLKFDQESLAGLQF